MKRATMPRIVAAALAVGVCSMLGWAPAVAQESSGSPTLPSTTEADWAFVTGREESCSSTDWQTTTEDGLYRGWMEFACVTRLSDPRVSGPASGDYNLACYGSDECLYWGSYEIVSSGGSWVGGWSGIREPDGGALFRVTTEGTGDYAGWTFVAVLSDPLDGSAASVHGLIFEGNPPPWERVPSVE